MKGVALGEGLSSSCMCFLAMLVPLEASAQGLQFSWETARMAASQARGPVVVASAASIRVHEPRLEFKPKCEP